MKKLIGILLSVLLIVSSFSVFAWSDNIPTEHGGVIACEKILVRNDMYLSMQYLVDGKEVWSHQTEPLPMAMVDPVSGCFVNGDTVYFTENDTLRALDLFTGEQKWEVQSCGNADIAFDQWGNIYSCSFDGINLAVVNPDGAYLYGENTSDYYMVFDLEVKDNQLIICSQEDSNGTFVDNPYGIGHYVRTMDIQRFRPLSILVDGKPITFDKRPFLQNGRTLVPLRAIFEALGAEVFWMEDTQTVAATRDNTNISLQIGRNQLFVNDKTITLDVSAQLVGDRTFVPARAISEAFGCEVGWDDASYTVTINRK